MTPVRSAGVHLAPATRQGSPVDYAEQVNAHGDLLINTVEFVANYPGHDYRNPEAPHAVMFVPVEHEGLTERTGRVVVGGWQLHHDEACPGCALAGVAGRVDAFVFAEQIHIAGAKVPPALAAALDTKEV